MDLNAIQALLRVVRAGGFSAAARQLGVPPNRLSRQVKQLEERLGVRLLHRTTRHLSLTANGRALVEGAETNIASLDQLWRDLSAKADIPRGHLRVAAPANFINTLSADRLAIFLAQYPEITLEILLSDDVVDLAANGIELAIRAGPIRDENLVARKLADSRLILVASADYVDRYGLRSARIDALSSYPCVTLRCKDGRSLWTLDGPADRISAVVTSRLTVNAMGALIEAANAGLGIALVSQMIAAPHIASGNLVQLWPDYCQDGGGLFVVYPSHRQPSAAQRAFIDYLLELRSAADLSIEIGSPRTARSGPATL